MHAGRSQSRTILVIDDNAVVLEMTRSTLEMAGFRVLIRDRTAGAIGIILQEHPDLVLLDVNMPNLSGDSLADILSRTRATRGTAVVLYSSLPANALRMKALATGAQGFIQKTSVQDELVRQVRAFLQADSRGIGPAAIMEESARSSAHIRAALEVEASTSGPPSSGSFRASAALPAAEPISASAPPPRHDSGTLRLLLPTALFLDDDLAVLTSYRRSLSSDEVLGEYSTSGDQALRRISASEPPDVVVTDLVMPGLNGMELYRRALDLDPTWRHRFVFVTGAGNMGYVAEFLRRVGGRALDKPVDMRRLRDAIRYAATGARIFRRHSADG
jgi:CheY-like chemotaxis protein